MATWVGVFVSNCDGKSVRELEVEAFDEVDAIVQLDFHDYDETWRHYSCVKVHRKKGGMMAMLAALKKSFAQLLGMQRRKPHWQQPALENQSLLSEAIAPSNPKIDARSAVYLSGR